MSERANDDEAGAAATSARRARPGLFVGAYAIGLYIEASGRDMANGVNVFQAAARARSSTGQRLRTDEQAERSSRSTCGPG